MRMDPESSGGRLSQLSSAVRESTLKRLRSVSPGFECWRPTSLSMSSAELAQHLLDSDRWLFGLLDGNAADPIVGPPVLASSFSRPDYDALLSNLETSGLERQRRLAGLSDARLAERWHDRRFGPQTALWWTIARGNLDHEIHHRGQLCVYLRLMESAQSEGTAQQRAAPDAPR
jgi:uncharacterized damage-inducible protein DinB